MKLLLLLAIPSKATQIDHIRQTITTTSSPTPGNVEKTLAPTITITRIPTPLPTFLDRTGAPSLMNEGVVPSLQPSKFSTPFPTEGGDDSVSGGPVTSAPQSLPPRNPTREPTKKPSSKPTNIPTYGSNDEPTHRPINIPPTVADDVYKSYDDKYYSYETVDDDDKSNDDNYISYEKQHDKNEWHGDKQLIEADHGSSKSGKRGKPGKGSKGYHKAGKGKRKSGKGDGKSSKSTSKSGKGSIGNNDNENAWHGATRPEKGVGKSGKNSGAKSVEKWQGDMDGGHPSWWDGYYRGLRQVGH
eukprot:CCRYP_008423-RA/>CCRYP_008423-RA protein AED:0.06 eAED:0.06 QI:199/1/1/1/1/1/2/360/299